MSRCIWNTTNSAAPLTTVALIVSGVLLSLSAEEDAKAALEEMQHSLVKEKQLEIVSLSSISALRLIRDNCETISLFQSLS